MQESSISRLAKHKNWLFFGLYLLILLLNVIFHEAWRDEFHSWNISRVSASLGELMENKAYEGHPSLWYLFCWVLTRLTAAPEGLAIMHLLIVAAGGYLFFRYAPFPALTRMMILLGYFLLFEYGTLARNYAILIVLLWAYCALRTQQKSGWLQLLMIGLMMFTQIYGVLLAMALLTEWLWEYGKGNWKRFFMGGAAFSFAFILAYLDINPPADVTAHARWYSEFSWESISYALSVLWEAFVPIPQWQFHFWNTNFLELGSEQTTLSVKALAGLAIWCVLALGLLQTRRNRILFLLGTLACLAFAFAKFHGYMRHHGHLFLWFLMVLWLEKADEKTFFKNWRQAFLYLLLGIQLLAGIIASVRDWQGTFSPVKEVAAYIQIIESQHPHDMWVSDPDYLIEPIGAMLQHPLYFPKQEKLAYFPQWDKNWGYISPEEVLLKAQLLAATEPVLLILGYEMKAKPDRGFQLEFFRQFGPGIEPSEHFWVYELRKSHPPF